MVQRRYFQGSGGRLPEELGTFDGHREPKVRDESALPPPAGRGCPVGSSGGTEPFPGFCAGPPVSEKDAHARCSAPRGYAQACRAFVIALVLVPRVRGGLLAAKT